MIKAGMAGGGEDVWKVNVLSSCMIFNFKA